jgi:cell division protein FtsZ
LKVEEPKEEVKRFTLEDDMEEMDLDTVNTRETVSPKKQQERSQERLSKIQEYTQRLKKADGIQDLEKEPAYIRRNITLDDSKPSEEDNTSRFSVSKGENGSSLSGNNSFLHDNVD